MKSLYIYLGLFLALCTACDDVVDIKLQDDAPKLVIEALINWEKGTAGNEQQIVLRESSSFFKEEVINATNATVSITHENGTVINFTEAADTPGIYQTSDFVPEIDATYTLSITYKNEEYTAVEKMIPVTPITDVSQRIEDIADEEIPVIAFTFDDPAEANNFYLVNYLPNFQERKSFGFGSDEFQNGNEIEIILSSEFTSTENEDEIREFASGDVIELKLFGISRQYHDYFEILTQQAEPNTGPFALAPAAAIGNCINVTNPENRPFGYFRLGEVDTEVYTYE
ncbi:DUF4249 domain-containing protein [Aquimarina agarivorans]|uniref:DUF4249 domain-containing protein n=1 Tax=Aquimarina agarivorans TaxID=980584 RepID=UPI000248E903|nr:DUF4249 domain-containing protein [Aquimarina agarivorans]